MFLEEIIRTSTWTYVVIKFEMKFVLILAYSMLSKHMPPDSEKSIPNGVKTNAELSDYNRREIKHLQ